MRGLRGGAWICLFASLALVATAWGAAGNRDRSFGKKGLAIIDEPSEVNEEFANLLILKSGRIFAGGSVGGSGGFLVGKFKRNGRPVKAFGPRGLRIQPFDGLPNRPRALSGLDFDSKRRIVAAGLASSPGMGFNAFGFARYRRGGALDTSFGDGGVKIVQPGMFGDAFDVAAAPGNKVVAGGFANGNAACVVRLTAAGQPDPGFGLGGVRTFNLSGSSHDSIDAVLPLGSGSLLVGGFSELGGFVAKLTATGDPALGFGPGGVAAHDFGEYMNPTGEVHDIALAKGGKILLTGEAYAGPGRGEELFAARLKPNGQLDPSFASGGIFRLDPTTVDDSGFALAKHRKGKVLIAGQHGHNIWLVRLTRAGKLDHGYGKKGQRVVSAGPGSDLAAGLAIDRRGRAVIAGAAGFPSGERLLLGRFLGDRRRP